MHGSIQRGSRLSVLLCLAMSTTPTPVKAKRLPLLFDHNPPESEALILDLFCNRTMEMERGLDGLRSPDGVGKIQAIYGLPRSGKSHFARALLLRAKQERLPYLFVEVNANNRGTAKSVLEEVFFKLWALFRGVSPDDVPDGQTGVYDEYLAELAQYEQIVGRDSAQFTIERTASRRESTDGGLKLTQPPFEFSWTGKSERESGETDALSQSSLTERELTEILRYAVDGLSWLYGSEDPEKAQQVLLLIDDLDLLDSKGREGQPESDVLVDHLRMLAEHPSLSGRQPCRVLATIRNASFTDRDKDYRDFVGLPLLEKENHLEIYQRHIDLFNAGQPVFSAETLDWLEDRSGGQVGIFLRRCHEIAVSFYNELKAGKPISIEQIKSYIKKDVRDYLRNAEVAGVMSEILAAIRNGNTELELSEAPRALEFKVLHHTGEARKYRINAMYAEVMRSMQQRSELP